MNRTIIIKTDGSRIEKEWSDALRPSLDDLQSVVGGYIEHVPLLERYEDQPAAMYCNEEGKLNGLYYNKEATRVWATALGTTIDAELDWNDPFAVGRAIGDVLVGDCIIVTGTQDFVDG